LATNDDGLSELANNFWMRWVLRLLAGLTCLLFAVICSGYDAIAGGKAYTCTTVYGAWFLLHCE